MMDYQIIRQQDCHTGHWSGGSTTELFLWPHSASYTARDFSLRVSTATVDVDTSDFTPLPGYTRLLMTVRGEMLLQIEGRDDVALPPWATVRFDGGVITRSAGRCVDFGVMLGAGWEGTLHPANAGAFVGTAQGFTGVYLPSGNAAVTVGANSIGTLNAGDLLILYNGCAATVQTEFPLITWTAFPKK